MLQLGQHVLVLLPHFSFSKIKAFFSERDAKSLSLLLPLKHPVLWVWQLRHIDLHCNKVLHAGHNPYV